MNNTQEDQQGVDTQALHTVNDATDKSIDTAINSASWFFGPDPKLPLHYQITTPHEPGCGVINVGTFPNLPVARHVCKLHNDWLQFKENKRLKKQNKLLDALKTDYTLYKKGFGVLQGAGFDLTNIGGKQIWVADPTLTDRITEFIKDNKTDIEKVLFLFWYKWHFNDMNLVISRYYTGKGCNQFLDHFTDITMFDTKNTRTHWAYNEWHCKTRDGVEWLIADIAANPELNTPITFKEPNSVAAYGSINGLEMMVAMASEVHAWTHKVKKLTEPAQAFLSGNAAFSIDNGTYTERKIDRTDGIWGITINPQDKSTPHCMRGKSCKDGCEFYDRGFCRGVCYPTYPPQYKRCEFETNGNAGQQYFTDEEINGFRGETNEPNRPGTNWKVGEPMPPRELDDYEIKELIRKHGERMTVEEEDGETYLYRRLELENPVHNPKFLGLNPVYDVIALRCPEKEDEETCLFEMECKVICPADRSELVVKSNDGLMIDSQLDLAAEVKSTVENLVKLSGRQVGKSSVNANASRELAKILLGKGVVKEADEKVKAFINDDLPVEEDDKGEQSVDRSGAHKPLTVTKNTIKERPQTYYVERSFKDIVSHLHEDEKIRAVVCFNSRLMSYMPPTNNKTITIANFLGHTKSMAELYKQWMIPEGKQVEEFLSHDWWYDKKHKCWTYVCNISCEKDPFKFMTLTPVLWDNHTYLGKDRDYKEAPFKYTDG